MLGIMRGEKNGGCLPMLGRYYYRYLAGAVPERAAYQRREAHKNSMRRSQGCIGKDFRLFFFFVRYCCTALHSLWGRLMVEQKRKWRLALLARRSSHSSSTWQRLLRPVNFIRLYAYGNRQA